VSPLEPDYDRGLVEAAVLLALRARPEARDFHRERDPLYEQQCDVQVRDAAFGALHARWFERLDLDRPVRVALAEQPRIGAGCGRCLVARAPVSRDESADLLVAPSRLPVVLVTLTVETLAAGDRALPLLRHEFTHVTDMLDPGFGYEPLLPGVPGNSPSERLLRERYRALWAASIDGRLARRGLAPPGARAERWRGFTRVFPELGDRGAGVFARFWDGERPTHADLVRFAAGEVEGLRRPECPLCGLSTRTFASPSHLEPSVLASIAGDFPRWMAAAGLCARCAELYRARATDGPGRASRRERIARRG